MVLIVFCIIQNIRRSKVFQKIKWHRLIWKERNGWIGVEMSRCPESAQCLERWVWSSILSEWLVSGFSPTFTFPLSFPAPKSHTGTKAKVSEGWGCDAGLEGVDPLGGPDRGPSFFSFLFFFSNPLSEWAQRGESPQSNTHERVYCERWALLQ